MMSLPYTFDNSTFPNNSDDDQDPGPSSLKGIKRGARACDRCRKLKSKCEPTAGDQCKNCAAANAQCTYQGPSFKRGPPKGYIHAIEQRWHQVECILASIMASPQAQPTISELRSDPFARAILNRVDAGPYGASGQANHQQGTSSSENFYATIMGSSDASRDDRRARRQSRMTREIVSIEDATSLATPSREWQEQLIRRLGGTGFASSLPPYTTTPVSPSVASPDSLSSPYHGHGQGAGNRSRQRRRLGGSFIPETSVSRSLPEQYANSDDSYSNWDEVDDTADSFGHLALDDHKEIRYHGHSSGLPLLARSERKIGEARADGIWKFPSLKQEQRSDDVDVALLEDTSDVVQLPELQIQQYLISLYFTYVHPYFPVIHKQSFLDIFSSRRDETHTHQYHQDRRMRSDPSTVEREPMQTVTNLLLLSMFSIAAPYWDHSRFQHAGEDPWNAGTLYALDARRILNDVYRYSKPSTVQSLLLLGMREFGVGSMEQGWLFTGMALRMAVDLGLNRNADNWTDRGKDLFTPVEKQIRKQIWWSCCTTDKLSAMWMGRPITFRASDYTTLKPDRDEEIDRELWCPFPPDALGPDFHPMPSSIMSCFREQCNLSIIITDIMDQIYPVKTHHDVPRRTLLQKLEQRLQEWLVSLPDHLQYSHSNGNNVPLPHILMLHVEYCTAVLLLHRAFIPHANGRLDSVPESTTQLDPVPKNSFDICQSAAIQISSAVTLFQERYGLDKAPPYLSIYLQSAGIMHVITLTRYPNNPQALIGRRQCIHALEQMEHVWPGATRVRTLLEGARVKQDHLALPADNQPLRHKRSAEEAMGPEKNSDIPEQKTYPTSSSDPAGMSQVSGYDNNLRTQAMFHSLGFDPGLPGIPSTSYYPADQWWARPNIDEGAMQGNMMGMPSGVPNNVQQGTTMLPEGQFTFDPRQLSPEFMQGVQYPTFDPSSLYSPPHSQGR